MFRTLLQRCEPSAFVGRIALSIQNANGHCNMSFSASIENSPLNVSRRHALEDSARGSGIALFSILATFRMALLAFEGRGRVAEI